MVKLSQALGVLRRVGTPREQERGLWVVEGKGWDKLNQVLSHLVWKRLDTDRFQTERDGVKRIWGWDGGYEVNLSTQEFTVWVDWD